MVVCRAREVRATVSEMRAADFRRMVLGLDGATEGAHMGHPDFRVNNRIFASLHSNDQFGMVALTPEQQQRLMAEHPETFTPESGAWGRGGSTRVLLHAADQEAVGEALTLAWQNAVQKAKAKRAKPVTSSRKRKRTKR
jgi:hypothetical protein